MIEKDPRVRDTAFMGFVAGLPCIACMVRGVHKRGVHVAHLRGGSREHDKRPTGMGEKPSDRWTTPLCPFHHIQGGKRSQHHFPGGEEAFWAAICINPFDLCQALNAAFDAGAQGYVVISRFAAAARRAIG